MPEMTEVLETRRAMFWAALVAECAGEAEVRTDRIVSALVRSETVTCLCRRLGASVSALREAVDGAREPSFEACRERILRELDARGIELGSVEHRGLIQLRPMDAHAQAVFNAFLETERQFRVSPLEVLLAFAETHEALAEALEDSGLDPSAIRSAAAHIRENRPMHFETKAIHAGMAVDPETGALAPPLHLSTTFHRTEEGEASHGYDYVRDGNPTQDRLEEALAALDGGAKALAFASGMAAGAALLQALPRGAHILIPDDCYYGYRALADEHFERWGLTFTVVAMEDLDAVRSALRRETRVIWAESPSNPLLKIVDLAALGGIAREAGARLVVDGTFATPALQRPIELGADVVLHSTTKYLGGHTDVQGGALVFREAGEWMEATAHVRKIVGGVASPFNSWLVLRGIRTLAARMRVHCENAMAVAKFLATQPAVEAVFYPGLESHPGHAIARRQMSGPGGMLSFLVRGGRAEALGVAARTKLFTRATSLGGVESLIEHRNSSEGAGSRTAQNLLRVSVGLEHPDDLIADLAQAIESRP